ncbi:MAG: porin [Hyphomicrobiaceae bacterium]|nr:porin [Hyphomicrobiaceae bacterium]
MKTTTKFALAALATALMGSTAIAADLGGSCCADLEERIAELEATTVRKGNRKVSLQISGFVGHQVMWWDDGTQSDMYIADGGNIFSRFRFRGSAKINADVSAGFTYEFAANPNSITAANQLNGGDDLGASGANSNSGADCANGLTGGCAALRDATVWMKHERLGMVKIGQGSTSTDNLILIDVGGLGIAGTPDAALYNLGFLLRADNGVLSTLGWGGAIRGHESFDTARRNHVLYESPSLHGFTLQAAVAEDNYWDIALRYAGEFNGVRIAFGIGYQEDTEFNRPLQSALINSANCNQNCDVKATELKGSASILHVATGLFLTAAAGVREIEGQQTPGVAASAYAGPDDSWWYLAGGLSRNFFGIGKTVLFAEYLSNEGGLEQAAFIAASGAYNNNRVGDVRSSSEMDMWGIGINQYIDAAAMEVFATYKNYSLDATGFADAALNKGTGGVSDFSTFIVGTRINF